MDELSTLHRLKVLSQKRHLSSPSSPPATGWLLSTNTCLMSIRAASRSIALWLTIRMLAKRRRIALLLAITTITSRLPAIPMAEIRLNDMSTTIQRPLAALPAADTSSCRLETVPLHQAVKFASRPLAVQFTPAMTASR